jgi:hypothetical protein
MFYGGGFVKGEFKKTPEALEPNQPVQINDAAASLICTGIRKSCLRLQTPPFGGSGAGINHDWHSG